MTGQRDDDARCWDCGHPWDTDCGCTCCCDGPPEPAAEYITIGPAVRLTMCHPGVPNGV